MDEAAAKVGRMSGGHLEVMKRLMDSQGVAVRKHSGREVRSFAPIDVEACEADKLMKRATDEGVLHMAARTRGGESWAILVLQILAMSGRLDSLLRCSKVSRYLFEFSLGSFRADLVIWHEDGGVSIVEAKGAETALTGVVSAFGQVSMYALMYLQQCPKPPAYLKKYVVAPVAPEDLALCCFTGVGCNVQFVPAPPFEEFREQIAALGAFICRE
jgi:hypothetical protein